MTRHVDLPDGRVLTVRPVEAADAPALAALYDRLDDDARYLRFFSLYRPHADFFERMATAIERGDYGVVALVRDPGGGVDALVGEAGYSTRARGGDPELSITVDREWRGWLGAYLLDALLDAAAERGVPNLRADVLLANRPMLALARSRGYVTTGHPDWTVVTVLLGTEGRTPTWKGRDRGPRVLVEVPGGRWPAEAEAREGGFDVLVCPGPGDPAAHCPALSGAPCPLAADADAIVVRPRLDDERWKALVEAHAQLHPGVPVFVEGNRQDGRATLLALAPRFAERSHAARSDT